MLSRQMQFRLSIPDDNEDNPNGFSHFFNRATSFHPLLFGHILIRLGHEPYPPALRHTPLSLMGAAKPVYMYPWIGKYVWSLMRDVGIVTVCTAGFASSLISSALMSAAEESALKFIRHLRANHDLTDETVSLSSNEIADIEVRPVHSSNVSSRSEVASGNAARGGGGADQPQRERHPSIVWALRSLNNINDVDAIRPENEEVGDIIEILSEERSVPVFVANFLHLLLWRVYGIVISHPFRVVMVRQVAYAAAGGEKPYTWLPQAIRQVYRENGLGGFYQGLLPSLLAEVLVLSSVVNIYRLLRLYLLDEVDSSLLYVVRSILWIFHNHYIHEPLMTVADLLAVRGSGLRLPVDLREVASSSWRHCWDHLVSTQQLLRASSWFFRRRVPAVVTKSMRS